MLKKVLYFIIGVLLLVVILWWTRYQIVEVPYEETSGLFEQPVAVKRGFYRVNRFTGRAELVVPVGRENVRLVAIKEATLKEWKEILNREKSQKGGQ